MSFLRKLFSMNDSSQTYQRSTNKQKPFTKTNDDLSQVKMIGKYYKISDLQTIPLGGEYSMVPIDAKSVFEESDKIILNSLGQTARIKRYLPILDFSIPDNSSEKFFLKLVKQTEMGLGFSYGIRQSKGLLGIIMVDTPALNQLTNNFENWTISFFVLELFENKRILSTALPRLLFFLREKIGVKRLYAIVDSDNTRSIHLLQKFFFEKVNNSEWYGKNNTEIPMIYCCDLTLINFH